MENNDDYIRRQLIKKYNLFYRHWKDLNLLVALFAITGLILSLYTWESSFADRGVDGKLPDDPNYFSQIIVLVISLMGIVAIILKFYFEAVWQNYKNPVAFYKAIV